MDTITNITDIPIAFLPSITTNAAVVVVAALIATLFISSQLLQSISTSGDSLEITQLYCYPVKGLRGCALQQAHLGKYGFIGDRTFSLQRVRRDGDKDETKRYETMLAGYYLQLALFQATVEFDGRSESSSRGEVVVRWHGGDTDFGAAARAAGVNTKDEIRFPLEPSTQGCDEYSISLHASDAKAYDMGDKLSSWFSERLGFETRLAYIGNGSRPVLGSMAPHSKGGLKRARLLQRIQSLIPFLSLPEERLVFNDLAHYLVVTEESNDQVTSRLDGDYRMDITKFRPNIVVKGASGPFVEDFWGELTFGGGVQMPLTANCYRCQSITVDFATGKTATDDRGMAWKKLNKDRRVDKGAKYSPVFGRYGYCFGSSVGKSVKVGESVKVTHVNAARTTFDWPHLTTFGLNQTKK
ncbi:Mitochondrial amidoxime-reducing component 1 [Colletotrichum siamense]|uniref:Mitochondrial amidoxime-reducing component 1 n=1 Tax=Colletotrichum siamense TaxID=690259 RepID=UPI001872D785|nr:Mitochondrial amidoxime-reducing component 1 [Colletotrichum siamense]KAF5515467.1 Mitochondrial amidoxime-reducing component 1 [Colletotrichum siamense]